MHITAMVKCASESVFSVKRGTPGGSVLKQKCVY